MASQGGLKCETYPAGADLSTKQYHYVKLSSGTVIVCSSAGEDALGILQNNPTSGEAATVALLGGGGRSKVIAGAAITAHAKVQTNASGRAIDAASGDHVLSTHVAGGSADGNVAEVDLHSSHLLA